MLIASLIGAGAVRALVVRDSMQVLITAPTLSPQVRAMVVRDSS